MTVIEACSNGSNVGVMRRSLRPQLNRSRSPSNSARRRESKIALSAQENATHTSCHITSRVHLLERRQVPGWLSLEELTSPAEHRANWSD